MTLRGSLADYVKDKALMDLDEDAAIDHALFQCHESLTLLAREFNNPKAQALAEEVLNIRKAGDLLQESDDYDPSAEVDVDEGNTIESLWQILSLKISQVYDFIDCGKKIQKEHWQKLWTKWQEFSRCLKGKGLIK